MGTPHIPSRPCVHTQNSHTNTHLSHSGTGGGDTHRTSEVSTTNKIKFTWFLLKQILSESFSESSLKVINMKSQLPRYRDGFLFLELSLVGQHVGLSALDSDHRVVFYIGPGPRARTDCLLRALVTSEG